MNKRVFDLVVMVDVLVAGAFILPRLWATRRVASGPQSGVGYGAARVTKAITA
jgi:hypothetical protein